MKSLFSNMKVGKKFIVTFVIIFVATTGSMAVLFLLSKSDAVNTFFSNLLHRLNLSFILRDDLNKINQAYWKLPLEQTAIQQKQKQAAHRGF